MIGNNFLYNQKNLKSFGFRMVKAESDDSFGMARELLKGTITATRPEVAHYGAKYKDVIILYLFIVKDDCLDSTMKVSYTETRSIYSWLTSNSLPEPLYIESSDGSQIEFDGVFTDVNPYIYNGLNGFQLEFTCNSPFAYKNQGVKISASGAYGESETSKNVICSTDENMFIYPTITLTNIDTSLSNVFSIINESDSGNEMRFNLDSSYSKYVIDCKLKRIIADDNVLSLTKIGWNIINLIDYNNIDTGTYKAYWLRLKPNLNKLIISGAADCLIKYKIPIKIGGFMNV